MELVIRKPGKDLIKFLLDKAMEEAMDLKVVRLLPDGLFIPLELADAAGLLDQIKTVPETNDEPERESEPERPKRAPRAAKRKPAQVEEVPEEDPTEDPWI